MRIVQIPVEALSGQALDGLIEEFVTRDGTDYGAEERTLDDKKSAVKGRAGFVVVRTVVGALEALASLNPFNDVRRLAWFDVQERGRQPAVTLTRVLPVNGIRAPNDLEQLPYGHVRPRRSRTATVEPGRIATATGNLLKEVTETRPFLAQLVIPCVSWTVLCWGLERFPAHSMK